MMLTGPETNDDPYLTPRPPFMVSIRRFDHQRGGDWPGNRGLMIEARRHSNDARVFSPEFPTVFVTDSIEVSMDEGRWPADEFLAWIDTIRPHLIAAAERATAVKDGTLSTNREDRS